MTARQLVQADVSPLPCCLSRSSGPPRARVRAPARPHTVKPAVSRRRWPLFGACARSACVLATARRVGGGIHADGGLATRRCPSVARPLGPLPYPHPRPVDLLATSLRAARLR